MTFINKTKFLAKTANKQGALQANSNNQTHKRLQTKSNQSLIIYKAENIQDKHDKEIIPPGIAE
jgi:hypothetical protein